MAAVCDVCGKGPQFGHNVSHSKRRTNRRWLPNLQTTTVLSGERPVKIRVCSRCLRTLRKAE
ncbi:MAG: 50S ribosomal protein L28 [Chloroflexi bacterium]|nr:50S ribosomal protein L28 [Chloroflexota bacterium]